MRILRKTTYGQTEGTVETKMLNGRDYLVVPVVALVEGVRHANGASNPELVLASSFGRFPETWNGRPVVVDHPVGEDGNSISASTFQVLESAYLGYMMNSTVEDGKLKTEAWLDLSSIGQSDSEKVATMWERLDAGEVCEVSVGCYVYMKELAGEHEGQKYDGVWDIVIPDHLAFLSGRQIGACSIADGCGTFRTQNSGGVKLSEGARMKVRALMAANKEAAAKKPAASKHKPALKKAAATPDGDCGCGCKGSGTCKGSAGESAVLADQAEVVTAAMNRALFSSELLDADKRAYLQRALDKDYKYSYVVAFSDDFVVFSAYNSECENYLTYQIAYSSDGNNVVTLSGEPQEVVFQAKVVPVPDKQKGSDKNMAKGKSKSEDDRQWKEDDTEDENSSSDQSEDDAEEEDKKSSKSSGDKSKAKDKKMSAPQSVADVLKSLEGTDTGRTLSKALALVDKTKKAAIDRILKAGGKHLSKDTLEAMELDVLQGMAATFDDIEGVSNGGDENEEDPLADDTADDHTSDDGEEEASKTNLKGKETASKKADPKKKSYVGRGGTSSPTPAKKALHAPEPPDVFDDAFIGSKQ